MIDQVWILEPYGDGDSICLRSHMHKFLAVDQFGNVTCENEEKDDTAKFEISVCDDFSGRWAFRSVTRGYFLGASADNLVCSAKSPGDGELWYVNLAARPQVNVPLRSQRSWASPTQLIRTPLVYWPSEPTNRSLSQENPNVDARATRGNKQERTNRTRRAIAIPLPANRTAPLSLIRNANAAA